MTDQVILGVTKGGKEIVAFTMPNRSVMALKFTTGGELPEELQGAFSGRQSCLDAVGKYLSTEKKPRKKRALSKSKL